jgi:hypothetical protein
VDRLHDVSVYGVMIGIGDSPADAQSICVAMHPIRVMVDLLCKLFMMLLMPTRALMVVRDMGDPLNRVKDP